MLYNVGLISAVQQSESAIRIHTSPLFLHFLSSKVTSEHWVEFPVLYRGVSLVIYFIHSSVYMEKAMATHSSVLAWRIPKMGEPGGLPSMGSHRVGHD